MRATICGSLLLLAMVSTAGAASTPCIEDGRFPEKLSESGCFADLASQTPAEAFVAYEINAPLWTDGAAKRRWAAVPPGQYGRFDPEGRLELPAGSVLMKEFRLEREPGRVSTSRPVETRLMHRGAEGWRFASYRWNQDTTDAVRVSEKGETATFLRLDGAEKRPFQYQYPSASACTMCHGPDAQVLGPSRGQLARRVQVDGSGRDQLRHLRDVGILAPGTPTTVSASEALPDPADTRAPLERRARAYLHANCGHCHRPGGWVPPTLTLDLRYDRGFSETMTCGVDTQYFTIQQRIAPGAPAHSALWRRIEEKDLGRMPPAGTTVHDPGAIVVRDWITSLRRCPSP